MTSATNSLEASYVLLLASMLGFLVGLGLVVYGWPRPCGLMVPECSESYILVFFGVVTIATSVGLMTYSFWRRAR